MASKLTRRGFLNLATVTAGLTALAACAPAPSGQAGSEEEGVTVQFWIFWNQPGRIADQIMADPALPDYMGDNTLEFRTGVANEARLAAVAAGTPPDIGALGFYLDFMARDVVVELTDYIAASSVINEEDFIETNWQQTHYEGVQKGVPAIEGFVRRGFFYNAGMVAEAGLDPDAPPLTWDEALVWHNALTQFDENNNLLQIGLDPYDAEGGVGPGNDGFCISDSFGFHYFDEDTKEFNLDNEEFSEGLEVMGEFIRIIGPDNLVGMRAVEGQGTWGGSFNAQIQACIIEGYWMSGETFNEVPDVAEQLRVSWTPVPERRRGVKLQQGGGHMVQMFRDGTYKDEAWPVAEWLQSDYWCDQIFHNIGWLPSYRPYFDNAPRDLFPGLDFIFDSVQEANYWGPQIRCEIEDFVRVKYGEFREAVYRDQISGAEAVAQMQELCTKEYQAAGFA